MQSTTHHGHSNAPCVHAVTTENPSIPNEAPTAIDSIDNIHSDDVDAHPDFQ